MMSNFRYDDLPSTNRIIGNSNQHDNELLPSVGHSRLPNISEQILSKGLILKGAAAAGVGSILGGIVSMIVNVALVEVSLSSFCGLYFGMVFLSVGSFIIYRISSGQSPDPNESHQKQLFAFACLVLLSGVVCLFLRRNWFMNLSWVIKILIYTLLGTSIAFALAFSLVDILNLLIGVFQSSAAKPLVQSIAQIRLILGMSIVMGGIFGLIFGLLDVEEEIGYHVRLALLREENYCLPIGCILGAAAGFGNEYIRLKHKTWHSLQQTTINEEI